MWSVIDALGDPAVRAWYLAFCVALMLLPMIGLAWWYHQSIRKTEGGRRLMTRHARSEGDLSEGIAMFRDVRSGQYGDAARAMHGRVYWIVGLWIVANVLAFGLLFCADSANGAGHEWRGERSRAWLVVRA